MLKQSQGQTERKMLDDDSNFTKVYQPAIDESVLLPAALNIISQYTNRVIPIRNCTEFPDPVPKCTSWILSNFPESASVKVYAAASIKSVE